MVEKKTKDLLRLTDLQRDEVYEIFHIADEVQNGKYRGFLREKSVVVFFLPQASEHG